MGHIGSTVVSVFVFWFVRQANIVRALKARASRSTSCVFGIFISYDVPEAPICSTTGRCARSLRSSDVPQCFVVLEDRRLPGLG